MAMRKSTLAYPLLVLFLLLCIAPARTWANGRETDTTGYKKPYTFTTDWFTGRIPSWERILKDYKGKPDVSYLEIGAFEGRSALWLLENILTHPTAKITVIDAFGEKNSYQTFSSNINLSGEPGKFKILTGYSTDKLKEVPANSIDFAYIDGSVKGIVVMADLVNTWNTLKTGGIVICNRYPLTGKLRKIFELQPDDPGAVEAANAFMKLYKPYIKVLSVEENEVIIQKVRQ
jgi:predicted O-methyltransferase YrrM